MTSRFKEGLVPRHYSRVKRSQTKSNPTPVTVAVNTATVNQQADQQRVLRPPGGKKNPSQQSQPLPSRKTRPSLSEQLAAIGAQAQTITNSLTPVEKKHTHGRVLFSSPAHSFKVGRLECRYPSPIQFFNDKCVYSFHHHAREVEMIMYFRDMRASMQWNGPQRAMKFKVARALEQFSTEDYNCHNSQHFIEIRFASQESFGKAKKIISSGVV